VSLVAAGLGGYDDRYVVDLFRLEGGTEKDRRTLQDLLHFCRVLVSQSRTELLYRYPELVMVEVGGGDGSDRIGRILDVYRRFAKQVLALAEGKDPREGTEIGKKPHDGDATTASAGAERSRRRA
jgi:hypothetical protein